MKFVATFTFGLIITSRLFGQSVDKWFNRESIESTVFVEKEQSGQLPLQTCRQFDKNGI